MVWSEQQRRKGHQTVRARQAEADAEAAPIIRRGLAGNRSLRQIARDLDRAGIDPPGASSLNAYGYAWGKRRRSDGERWATGWNPVAVARCARRLGV